jgi:hypothetical protein
MKRYPIGIAIALTLAPLLLSCGNEPRPPAEPAPEEAPTPPPPAPAPVVERQDPTPEELPIAEDFEEESTQQISDDNFKAQLDTIEKEMDAEK